MVKILIGRNEENQRLDRFLRKYYRNAPLSAIYKLIRKDVKINGRRGKEDAILCFGDELSIYISDEESAALQVEKKVHKAKRQFGIAYEDENILAADKPFGLLTHGDSFEKKQHLANQVISYLAEKKEYVPAAEKTFTPAPANRLDRNTTGLVLFGKNAAALKELNAMIRQRDFVSKYYLTITAGTMREPLHLFDRMTKDAQTNKISLVETGGRLMETVATPLATRDGYSLVEVRLITGRTHQIRARLAAAVYPIIGDTKYGDSGVNRKAAQRYGLTTQFLHAHRICFNKGTGCLQYLTGTEIVAPLPKRAESIRQEIFGQNNGGI